MRARFLLLLLLTVAGCEREQAAPAPAPTRAAEVATATATASASPAGVAVEESTELYELVYSYPGAAAAIPALKRQLDADLKMQRGELAAMAREARDEERGSGFEFRPYESGTDWQVVTELPGWLSLSAAVHSYAGGVHSNRWSDALLWDKAAGRSREAAELFASPQALSRAIREPFCDAIDMERAERRGEPVNRDDGAMFNECIDPVEQTVILGSSNRRTFDRIGILVAPYNAGSYAEGDYEVTLPVTRAVLAAVRPEYRGAFSLKQ